MKIARWREKYDQIPEDTKDPGLMKAKKALKKKMPTRRSNEQYWNEAQFSKLCAAPPGNLSSRGLLPWRLLAYMLDASPDVDLMRRLVGKRLMDSKRIEAGQKELDRMLMTLWRAGYVTLEPEPPKTEELAEQQAAWAEEKAAAAKRLDFSFGFTGKEAGGRGAAALPAPAGPAHGKHVQAALVSRHPSAVCRVPDEPIGHRRPQRADPGDGERVGVAAFGGPFRARAAQDELPPGPLATIRLDPHLLQLGLATPEEMSQTANDEEFRGPRRTYDEERTWVLTLADKLRRLFDYDFAGVHDLRTSPVWAAGELLQFGGDFNKYVTSKALQKQEGVVFRHVLRLILLLAEFRQLCPPDVTEAEWQADLDNISAQLTESCRRVDPASTDKVLEEVEQADEVTEVL